MVLSSLQKSAASCSILCTKLADKKIRQENLDRKKKKRKEFLQGKTTTNARQARCDFESEGKHYGVAGTMVSVGKVGNRCEDKNTLCSILLVCVLDAVLDPI